LSRFDPLILGAGLPALLALPVALLVRETKQQAEPV
jgi:hypothetical protein